MAYIDDIIEQANAAVRAGADPAAVEQRMQQLMAQAGMQPQSPTLDKETKAAYKNAVMPEVVQELRASNKLPNSPLARPDFGNVESGVDTNASFLSNLGRGISGGLKEGVGAGVGLLAGLASTPAIQYLSNPSMAIARQLNPEFDSAAQADTDKVFALADSLRKSAAEDRAIAGDSWGGAVGEFIAGIPAFPVSPMSAGMQEIDAGESAQNAQLRALKTGGINTAAVGLGLLGSQAAGIAPFLQRAGIQAGGNVGLTAADRYSSGEDLSKKDIALGLAGGVFGGMFRNPPKAKATPVEDATPRTHDPVVNAGIEAYESLGKKLEGPAEQPDLFTRNNESALQGDLFGAAPVEGSLAEARRIAALDRALPARTEDAQTALEREYILDQQRRVTNPPNEGVVSRTASTPDVYKGIAKAELPYERPPLVTDLKEVVDANQNTLMHRKMQEALAQYRPEPEQVVQVPRQEVFEPSAVPTVEQTAVQEPLLPQEAQGELFFRTDSPAVSVLEQVRRQGSISPEEASAMGMRLGPIETKINGAKEAKRVAAEEKKIADNSPSLDDLRKQAAEGGGRIDELPQAAALSPFYRKESVPARWSERLSSGQLTFGEVLDDISKGAVPSLHPQIVNFASYINSLGKKFGGLDTVYKAFDENDSGHAAYLAGKALKNQNAGAGYYSRDENLIRIDPNMQNIHTYLHEGAHAVTVGALEAGAKGKLSGDAKLAFNRLNTLQKELAPIIQERTAGEAQPARQLKSYGATNLYEFIAELYTNPAFRNHLKSIEIPDIEARMSDTGRVRSSIIRNAYDVVTKNIRKLLGLPDKAQSALDMAISSGHEFFSKADRSEVAAAKTGNAPVREMAALDTTERAGLAVPASAVRAAKVLGRVGGEYPVLSKAREQMAGEINAARAVSTAMRNKAEALRDSVDMADVDSVLTSNGDYKSAFKRIKETAPELADVLNNYRQRRFSNTLDFIDQLRADPDLSQKGQAIANKAQKQINSWLTTVYAAKHDPNFTSNLWKKYEAGDQAATKTIQNARNYLRSKWLPDDLDNLNNADLKDLFSGYIGRDADALYQGLAPKEKADMMRTRIRAAIDAIADKDGFMDNVVKSVADMNDADTNAIARWYKNLQQDKGVMSTKEHIPPALRELWGEVRDPLVRMYFSYEKERAGTAQLRAQNSLRAEGLKTGLFSETPTATHQDIISGESFGPLQGLHAAPEVVRAMEGLRALNTQGADLLSLLTSDPSGSMFTNSAVSKAASGLQAFTGLNKAYTVMTNLGNIPLNAAGGIMQLMSNGTVVVDNIPAAARGIRTMANLIGISHKKNITPEAERAIRLGLVEFSQLQEISKSPASAALRALLNDDSFQANPVKYLATKGNDTWKLFTEVYGAADLWTKFVNFETQLDTWRKIRPEMSEQALEQFVADRINNTNITPSRSPLGVKLPERFGGTQYLTYYYQIPRNLAYNMAYGLADLKQGAIEKNPLLMTEGIRKLAGTAAVVGVGSTIYQAATQGLAGILGLTSKKIEDDDLRKKYIENDDFLSSQSPMLLTDPKHPEHGEFTIDTNRPNPYGPITQPIEKAFEAAGHYINGDEKAGDRELKIAGRNLWNLVSTNSLYKKVMDTVSGREPSIARTAPEAYRAKLESWIDNGLDKADADRLINAEMAITPGIVKNWYSGQEQPEGTMRNLVKAGVGVQEFNIGKSISNYLGRKFQSDINEARKPYLDVIKARIPTKPEQTEAKFKKGLKNLVEPYDKMADAIKAAQAQGLNMDDIAQKLTLAGVNKKIIGMIMDDQPIPVIMMLGDPKSTFKKEIAEAKTDAEREKLEKRAEEKMDLISQLYDKYGNTTIDELRNE